MGFNKKNRNKIILGYHVYDDIPSTGIGFKRNIIKVKRSKLIFDNSDAHLLTVAPTGAGKGISQIIPTCTYYPGSLLVIDPKGEAYITTARLREKIGEVYIIDPFKYVTKNPDKLNPFDIGVEQPIEQRGVMMAKAMQSDAFSFKSDPYWDLKANELIAALCIHELESDKSFVNLRKIMFSSDVDYTLAVLLDTKKAMNQFSRELLNAYLQIPSERTRPSVLSTAQQNLAILGDPAVMESLSGPTSFNCEDLLNGKPMTIYFVMPPNKILAYSVLIRLWVNTILNLFSERATRPEIPTLFIIDEAANIGRLESLVTAITLLRSYGLRVWPIFQDMGQLKQLYPNEWTTIINNCDVINVFGMRTYLMAKEVAEVLGGITPASILNMPKEFGLVYRAGEPMKKVKRLNYLKDAMFKNSGFEKNPFYAGKSI